MKRKSSMYELTAVEKILIKKKLEQFLEEDIRYGDITSKILENSPVKAQILFKSNGIACGIQEAHLLCEMSGIKILKSINDGDEIKKGTEIMQLSGNLHDILIIERTLLNIMMRMSSIASTTYKFTKLLQQVNTQVKIAATRKTTPGFRVFEKRAVMIGGKGYSDTHRWNLDDMVLLKDTHLNASKMHITHLIAAANQATSFTKKIELEVQTPKDAITAAESKVDIIMLDNMSPAEIKSTITKIKELLDAKNLPIFEASGNITLKNVVEYAKTGVNIISTSQITFHPQEKIDISLEIVE
jgi:nicotinate-nucleotide pyrophosphorylase (carboxylating)